MRMQMTRQEHLDWAKKRALAYVDQGDLLNAFASMGSDLSKHPELKNHPGIDLGLQLLMIKSLSTRKEMRGFIEGFN
jgi:hypothetical protein